MDSKDNLIYQKIKQFGYCYSGSALLFVHDVQDKLGHKLIFCGSSISVFAPDLWLRSSITTDWQSLGSFSILFDETLSLICTIYL